MQNKTIFLVLISFLSRLDASPSKLISCLIGSSKTKRDAKPVKQVNDLTVFLRCYDEFHSKFGILDQDSNCRKYLPVLMASRLE